MNAFIEKILKKPSPYVIAELGSNFHTPDDLNRSAMMARDAGADAIKYQLFTPRELYGPSHSDVHYSDQLDLFALKELADRAGIDFLCTAFSAEGVKRVDPFVQAHKVASSEMQHLRILDAVKETGKPVILSTGGQHLLDIHRVLQFFGDGYPVILMHCNLQYPARFVDLKKLKGFEGYEGVVGFSDHTTSVDAIPYFMTRACGCRVIEKHFNPYDYTDTPDAPHSLSQREFQVMTSYLRDEPIDYTEENEARLMHTRRIIATKDLKEGDVLKEGVNMGIFRSKKPDAQGMSPFLITQFEGRRVRVAKSEGDGLSLQDVD